MDPEQLDFSSLLNAVSRMEEAFKELPANDLERDGCIQRFEYTYELCWKMMRRQLISMEVGDADLLGRRELFREAARRGLIGDPEIWFMFQKAYNLTSHNYDADKAEETYAVAKEFLPRAKKLLDELLDLEQRHLDMLVPILKKHVPGARVWAFGSRVKGTARKFSDLDLAIDAGHRLELQTLALLDQDLSDSDLPIKVDVLDLASISPAFRRMVEAQRILLPAA
jgi:nucleotidyltransferase substrate binding protein (TIGR01987 family)